MKKILKITPICDDEVFLPHHLKYYDFIDKHIFVDFGGTDSSVDILKKAQQNNKNIEIVQCHASQVRHDTMSLFKNHYYKYYRQDYDIVMVADVDEIIYHPNIKQILNTLQPNQHFVNQGFQVVMDCVPSVDTFLQQIKLGTPDAAFNKPSVFDINLDMYFRPGHHVAYPVAPNGAKVQPVLGQLYLLHFKYLGAEYLQNISNKRFARRKDYSQRTGHSSHYEQIAQRPVDHFNEVKDLCEDISWIIKE